MADEVIGIDQLTPDEHNANAGTERGRYMLDHSLRQYGAGRSILIDKAGRIIAGNKTVEAAADIGITRVHVVHTTGDELVAVQRDDLDLEDGDRARLMAYADNRAGEVGLEWDAAALQLDLDAGLDLGEMFREEELAGILDSSPAIAGTEHDADEALDLSRYDVPDALFPSDNVWDIPTLDIHGQADNVHLPVSLWGALGRKARMPGTWAFYCDDYRFEALWKDPSGVVNTRCRAVIEPNFTTTVQMPRAVALWQIYRKRWLARWWQQFGVRVFVDLNVTARCRELNLLGVPRGWRAYATRGYSDQLEAAREEFALAREHAQSDDVLFLYYGGGAGCEELARAQGWVYVPEHMNVKAGGVVADG